MSAAQPLPMGSLSSCGASDGALGHSLGHQADHVTEGSSPVPAEEKAIRGRLPGGYEQKKEVYQRAGDGRGLQRRGYCEDEWEGGMRTCLGNSSWPGVP